eukprot:1107427-Rhodomonas_salina.1
MPRTAMHTTPHPHPAPQPLGRIQLGPDGCGRILVGLRQGLGRLRPDLALFLSCQVGVALVWKLAARDCCVPDHAFNAQEFLLSSDARSETNMSERVALRQRVDDLRTRCGWLEGRWSWSRGEETRVQRRGDGAVVVRVGWQTLKLQGMTWEGGERKEKQIRGGGCRR